jgi:hypothetical protein
MIMSNLETAEMRNKKYGLTLPLLTLCLTFWMLPVQAADYLILWRIHNHDNSIQQGDVKLTIPDDDIYPRPSTKTHKYGILHKKLHH